MSQLPDPPPPPHLHCLNHSYDPFNVSVTKFFDAKKGVWRGCRKGQLQLPVFDSTNNSIWLRLTDSRVKKKLQSIVNCFYSVIENRYSGKLNFVSKPISFQPNSTVTVQGNYVKGKTKRRFMGCISC